MLQSLSIRDFVIVKELNLEFSAGYTVLTGETGAGKSILIDALSLALGARAESGVTRRDCDKAEVNAIFNISANDAAKDWLHEAELALDDDELLLRRVMYADGRTRAFINGTPVSVAQQKELGELLIDIYSQNAHHSLLKLSTQRDVLDQFANLTDLAKTVAQHYKNWYQLHQQRIDAEKNAQAYAEELALLQEKVSELKAIVISNEDWLALQQAHVKLSNGAHLMAGCAGARTLISDGELSALQLLNQAQHHLSDLIEFDPSLQEAAGMLDSALIQLQETDRFLNRYLQQTDLDAETLANLDAQIQVLHQTARKYRTQPEFLAEMLEVAQLRFTELAQYANDGALAKQETSAHQLYMDSAKALSEGRQLAANKLSDSISAYMQDLSLSGGRFEVCLTPNDITAHGLETVEFLVAGHAGVDARPLNKVASGGELSRISLAIRVATAQKDSIPTMIFDEVDVGIGGGVAEVVGRLLKQLGENQVKADLQQDNTHNPQRQVLVITHLPQVAALGSYHLRVSKTQQDGQTLSTISELSKDERVDEIARMLGGVEITGTTRQHAKEMLKL
jgi:DNA repair protein RecN (Recombination protein N)